MAANVKQTSSRRLANVQQIHVYFEYICWKFAGRLLDRVNTLEQMEMLIYKLPLIVIVAPPKWHSE